MFEEVFEFKINPAAMVAGAGTPVNPLSTPIDDLPADFENLKFPPTRFIYDHSRTERPS
jgi:hypothetical protein